MTGTLKSSVCAVLAGWVLLAAAPPTTFEKIAVQSAPDPDEAVRQAIAATPWPEQPPLIEGWISRAIFTRLYPDRQIFIVVPAGRDGTFAPPCRVTFPEPFEAGTNAAASARIQFAFGDCSGDDDFRPVSGFRLSPSREKAVAGASIELNARDGTPLLVTHIGGAGIWLAPLLPDISPAEAITGELPGPLAEQVRLEGKETDFTANWIRKPGGGWAVGFKYGRGFELGRSGCVAVRRDGVTTPPNAGWLTAEARAWCLARQRAWIVEAPVLPVPMAVPPMTRPKRP